MNLALSFLIFFLSSLFSIASHYCQVEVPSEIQANQRPITKVSERYERISMDEEEELISEIEFQKKRCHTDTLKQLIEVLAHFSKVDGLIALKACAGKEKGLENKIKQQIFLLSKFPKLEFLPLEQNESSISILMRKLSILWEERVYFYSNFYHGQSLLWLGEEKELSEEINRILYTDMSEKRKANLLKKIIDDLETTNNRIYHLYQFSEKNLFQANSLEDENRQTKLFLQTLFTKLSSEESISQENREKLKSFNTCLGKIDIKNPETRLAVFIGFWQDYQFLGNLHNELYPKETKSIMSFLKKNILRSHHFERRLEKGLNVCELLTQSN